jgi:hypothetical protein
LIMGAREAMLKSGLAAPSLHSMPPTCTRARSRSHARLWECQIFGRRGGRSINKCNTALHAHRRQQQLLAARAATTAEAALPPSAPGPQEA